MLPLSAQFLCRDSYRVRPSRSAKRTDEARIPQPAWEHITHTARHPSGVRLTLAELIRLNLAADVRHLHANADRML